MQPGDELGQYDRTEYVWIIVVTDNQGQENLFNFEHPAFGHNIVPAFKKKEDALRFDARLPAQAPGPRSIEAMHTEQLRKVLEATDLTAHVIDPDGKPIKEI